MKNYQTRKWKSIFPIAICIHIIGKILNCIRVRMFPSNICSICNSRIFFGDESNPKKYCSVCHSHERHRALTKKLKTLPIEGKTFLEVAPLSPLIYGGVLKKLGCKNYLSCDKWSNGNPHDPRNEKFDYIIIQHVIEEIEDYKLGLIAINNSLNDSGTAILEIPSSNITEHIRLKNGKFGNEWSFSRSKLLNDLASIFNSVDIWNFEESNTSIEIFACYKKIKTFQC